MQLRPVIHSEDLDVGRDVSREVRVAFEVADSRAAADAVVTLGAELLAAPTMTPWGSLIARIEGPDGVQLTLFEQVEPE